MWRRHTISTLIFQRSVCYCCSNKTGWEQFIWFSTSSSSCCCSSYQKNLLPHFSFLFFGEKRNRSICFLSHEYASMVATRYPMDLQWIINPFLDLKSFWWCFWDKKNRALVKWNSLTLKADIII
jgi:hypothetical protein